METAIPITAASAFLVFFLIERFLPLRKPTRSLWHRLLINLIITGLAFAVAAHQPKKTSKVRLDITSDSKSGGVIKGFDRAALTLSQYTLANAGTESGLHMAIIPHGPAAKAALSHDACAKHTKSYLQDKGKATNPNLELRAQSKKAGVEFYVCGQVLAHHGYATREVAAEVKVAVSAATVNINLRMDGYACIPFQ